MDRGTLESAQAWSVHDCGIAAEQYCEQCPSGDASQVIGTNLPNPHAAWLVLAMASTLAGNLTITGSIANIIVVESAKPEVKIGF